MSLSSKFLLYSREIKSACYLQPAEYCCSQHLFRIFSRFSKFYLCSRVIFQSLLFSQRWPCLASFYCSLYRLHIDIKRINRLSPRMEISLLTKECYCGLALICLPQDSNSWVYLSSDLTSSLRLWPTQSLPCLKSTRPVPAGSPSSRWTPRPSTSCSPLSTSAPSGAR